MCRHLELHLIHQLISVVGCRRGTGNSASERNKGQHASLADVCPPCRRINLATCKPVTGGIAMQGSVQDAGQRPNQPVAPLSFLRVAEPLMKGTGYQILKTAALQTTS